MKYLINLCHHYVCIYPKYLCLHGNGYVYSTIFPILKSDPMIWALHTLILHWESNHPSEQIYTNEDIKLFLRENPLFCIWHMVFESFLEYKT